MEKTMGFFHAQNSKIERMMRMQKFTKNYTDRAYESFMQQVPGFHRDPPEAKVIQKDLESIRQKGKKKRETAK